MWLPLIILVVLALIFADQTFHLNWSQAPAAFLALPLLQQVIIGAVVVLALYLIGHSIWQAARVERRARDLEGLKKRLDSLVDVVARSNETQANLNSAVEHVVATDPEHTMMTLHQKVTPDALLTAQQQGLNAAVDLDARVDDIRRRQKVLREQLGEVT